AVREEYPMRDSQDRLDELKELGLYRRTRQVSGPQGPRVVLDGKPVMLLCSNNYLGLADHPRVRQAAADAAMRWGVGAGASRLISGNMTIHRRLEKRLADFEGSEACVLFGSGYLANTGTVAALAREGGRGAVAEAGLEEHVDVVVGTLGKALGSYGAYACCDNVMAQYLVNTARPLIFSTALPPPAVAGALAALELLEEQPRRVRKLQL